MAAAVDDIEPEHFAEMLGRFRTLQDKERVHFGAAGSAHAVIRLDPVFEPARPDAALARPGAGKRQHLIIHVGKIEGHR